MYNSRYKRDISFYPSKKWDKGTYEGSEIYNDNGLTDEEAAYINSLGSYYPYRSPTFSMPASNRAVTRYLPSLSDLDYFYGSQLGGNSVPTKSRTKSRPRFQPAKATEERTSKTSKTPKTPNKKTDDLAEQPLGFLTLEKFLSYFPPIKMSKDEFAKRFTISYKTPVTLAQIYSIPPGSASSKGEKSVIKSTDDVRWRKRQEVIDYFYEIVIQKRHEYLTHFYHSFFDFKDPMTLDWLNGPEIGAVSTGSQKKNALNLSQEQEMNGISMQKNDASRRLIRNLFYKDILDYTRITNSVKSKVSFWQTFDNLYNKLILEDRLFAPSSIDLFLKDKRGNERPIKAASNASRASKASKTRTIVSERRKSKAYEYDEIGEEEGAEEMPRGKGNDETNYVTMYYLIQNYQPKASILNPYTIYWIIDRLLPGTKNLFTPVLSWASYVMAFMHLPYTETYVGVDVIPRVCAKTEFLADWYHENYPETRDKEVDIYCQPSESLLKDKRFMARYTNFFDSVLFCPPYFDMEIYQGGDQSIELYPNYEDWLSGYWENTVKLCYQCLKKGRFFAYIINDYYDLDKNFYPLTKDLDDISSKYFELVDVYTLYNRTSPLRVNHKDRSEKLYIYRKP